MLAVNTYTQDYVDDCRKKVKSQLSAYKKLVNAARKAAADNTKQVDAAIASYEPVCFNNMVLALDCCFTNRTRAIEGKDGNPLNEVRVLCNSILVNDAKMVADKTIKMDPKKSVLKYEVGDTVSVSANDFERLSAAFFAEIEARFL